MDQYLSRTFTLCRGPSAATPITLVAEGGRNEEGEIPRIEMDFSVADADTLGKGLQRAADFVAEGIWFPGRSPAVTVP